MQAPYAYIVHRNGINVECYGDLEETSNFEVVCEDEYDDSTWCDGIEGPLSWEQTVAFLQAYYASDILQITAV
jgi:hypothetical protein